MTSQEGQAFALELKKRSAAAMVIQLDSTMTDADLAAAAEHAAQASQYVVAAFASVAAYRGDVALAAASRSSCAICWRRRSRLRW